MSTRNAILTILDCLKWPNLAWSSISAHAEAKSKLPHSSQLWVHRTKLSRRQMRSGGHVIDDRRLECFKRLLFLWKITILLKLLFYLNCRKHVTDNVYFKLYRLKININRTEMRRKKIIYKVEFFSSSAYFEEWPIS